MFHINSISLWSQLMGTLYFMLQIKIVFKSLEIWSVFSMKGSKYKIIKP